MLNFKKSQGEIFGIALLFVILIVGVIIYGQMKTLNPEDKNENSIQREKYEILASGTLDSILSMSTGCEVERGKDTVYDLVKYCEYTFYGDDPEITCNDGNVYGACNKTLQVLNSTLYNLYNNTDETKGIAQIPFKLIIEVPQNTQSQLNGKNITNFNDFKRNNITINESNYLRYGFSKAPSGLRTTTTLKRNVNFELYLYFR